MGVQCRYDHPGSFHHVISRAVDGKHIFNEKSERYDFIRRLQALVKENCFRVHAWVLMSNHFHLLLEVCEISLSCSMQRLLTGFSMRFNKAANRQGHLFQGRFRSILVDRESYLMELVRYIHLNPLRANIVGSVNKLVDYHPNGHNHIVGNDINNWQSTDLLEAVFANISTNNWIADYVRFLNEGIDDESSEYENGNYLIDRNGIHDAGQVNAGGSRKGAARIIGTEKFVKRVYSEVQGVRNIRSRNRKEQHEFLMQTAINLSETSGIPLESLRASGGGRRISQVRKVLIKLLINDVGLTRADTARFLRLSATSVARCIESDDDPSMIILRNKIKRSKKV